MPPKKKRLFKLYSEIENTRIYILELYAARYLWNLGYRCIGFNIYLEPYKRFSVVGVKIQDQTSIAVFDIITSKKDFYNKSKNPDNIDIKEKEITDKITKLANLYNIQDKQINFKEDKIWIALSKSLSSLDTMKNKTLYWQMINSYRVANFNWIIGFDKDIDGIDVPDGWGLIKLKESVLDYSFKTFKKVDSIELQTTHNIHSYIKEIQIKIAMALTKDVVGSDLLKPEKIQNLFKYLSNDEDMRIKTIDADKKIDKLEKEFLKSKERTEEL